MAYEKDDWEKSRSKGTHLTEAEIEFVRQGFKASRPIPDVARDLKCSSRTVTKYYGWFRASGVQQGTDTPRAPVDRNARFYKSSFEPT